VKRELDSTSRTSHSSSATTAATGQTRDQDVKEGSNGTDDALQDSGDTVDDGH
jgi:hypothetical protein